MIYKIWVFEESSGDVQTATTSNILLQKEFVNQVVQTRSAVAFGRIQMSIIDGINDENSPDALGIYKSAVDANCSIIATEMMMERFKERVFPFLVDEMAKIYGQTYWEDYYFHSDWIRDQKYSAPFPSVVQTMDQIVFHDYGHLDYVKLSTCTDYFLGKGGL